MVVEFSDLDIVKLNDERVLHEILFRKRYKLPLGFKERPVHGFMFHQIEELLILIGQLGM